MFFRVLFFILFATSSAQAIELTFGPEFTFTNQEILDQQQEVPYVRNAGELRNQLFQNAALKSYHEKLLAQIYLRLVVGKNQGEAFEIYRKRFNGENRTVLKSPHGWYATMSVDMGVFEWTTNPMTLEEFRQHKDEIQKVIFDISAEVGLAPALFAGGGHLNIGAGPFNSNRALLRNFVVDLMNHNELSMGVFSYDTNNAISPWLLDPYDVARILESLKLAALPEGQQDGTDFIRILSNAFSAYTADEYLNYFRTRTEVFYPVRATDLAMCFKRDKFVYQDNQLKGWRLELRSVRPQTSADVFLRQIELMQARVNYLEKLTVDLQPQPLVQINRDLPLQDRVFNPPVDPQQALKAFHMYVTESGLRWDDHQDYLWPRWISSGEVERFNCQKLLGHL